MKKLTFISILALAFTTFACGDDNKDENNNDNNGQQTEKLDAGKDCTKHADCKSEFCQADGQKKSCAEKIADNGTCKNEDDLCKSSGFTCKKADGETEFKCTGSSQQQGNEKLDAGKDCTQHADCKSEFCQTDGQKKLCANKIDDNGTCKNEDDLCKSSGFTCKKADGQTEFKCTGSSQQQESGCTGTGVDKLKCYDKIRAQNILACAESQNYTIDAEKKAELDASIAGTANYNDFYFKPYKNCTEEYAEHYKCLGELDCEEMLLVHFDDNHETTECSFEETLKCMEKEENLDTVADSFCLDLIKCTKGEDDIFTKEDSDTCYQKTASATSDCEGAIIDYKECREDKVCDVPESNDQCADKLADVQSKCPQGLLDIAKSK